MRFGRTRRVLRWAGIAAALAAAGSLTAGPAGAATIGSNPNQSAAFGAGCEVVLISPVLPAPPSCSMFDPVTSQALRGSWRVTSATVQTGPRSGPMRFTMIQALRSKAGAQGVICCTQSAAGPVFTPTPNSITRVNLNLPAVNTTEVIDGEQIEVVDYFGISLLDQSGSIAFGNTQTPATTFFAPAFTQGSTRLGGAIPYSVTPLIRAQLSACSGTSSAGGVVVSAGCGGGKLKILGRTRPFRGGTRIKVITRVPGPGVLRLRQASRGKKLVQSSATRVGKRRKVKIVALLSRKGKKVLRRRGKVKVKLRLTFKKSGGGKSSKKTRVVFRR